MKRKIILFLVATASFFSSLNELSAQLVISQGMTPTQYVQNVLVGGGVLVANVTFTGGTDGLGSFSNGNTTNLGLTSGIVISSGPVSGIPNTAAGLQSTAFGTAGDPDLASLASSGTGSLTSFDAAVLQFDFQPLANTVSFRYVFGSEEYSNYVNTGYNDVFGFFISGPGITGPYAGSAANIALIPFTTTPVAINNVNNGNAAGCGAGPCENCAYYVENCNGTSIVYNAFTTVLTATATVQPCQWYHIKLAVSDIGDGILDSGVFLEAQSFSTTGVTMGAVYTNTGVAGNNAIENCNSGVFTFVTANPVATPFVINYVIQGTATNGVDYTAIPASSVTIPAGSDSVAIVINPISDGITEGTETVTLHVQTVCGWQDITLNIIDNTPLIVTASPDVTICDGQQPVDVSASATGGITPYTPAWNNGLPAGPGPFQVSPGIGTTTYIVTVTDACGATATDNTVVTVNNCGNCNTSAGEPQSVCGLTLGALAATTNPGDYNTYWSGPAGISFGNASSPTSSVTASAPGTYTLTWTVTSSTGVTCFDVVDITFLLIPTSTFTVSNIPCFGNNSNIAYTGNGGGGATYTWNFNGGSATGSGSGPYLVNWATSGSQTVTLQVTLAGCSTTTTNTINNPPDLVTSVTTSNINCASGTNGTANVNVSGGTPVYTYTWSNVTGPPFAAGPYSVTITDANGCSNVEPFTIVSPNPITVVPNSTNLTCYNNNTGAASVAVSGGTPAYTYVWSNGGTSSSLTNIPAGIYTVTIADANVCTLTYTITVTQPTQVVATIPTNTVISCNGACDGTATAAASGGTPGYTYLWSSTAMTPVAAGLCGGVHTVTVTDNQGCTATNSLTLNDPSAIVIISQNSTNISCFNGHDGTISVVASGGTGVLNYTIGGGSQTNGNFTGLYPNSYNVTVTDANNCQVIAGPFNITQPSAIIVNTVTTTPVTCNNGSDGTITINASGGTAPLMYSVPGFNSATGSFSNLPAGSYTITITDANGCTQLYNPAVITQPTQIQITSQNSTTIPCHGLTAAITVMASGGTAPLSFSLGSTTQASGYFTGLSGGTYIVTITDANGCTLNSTPITIYEPPQITITSATATDILCFGDDNGTLSVPITGGTSPYTWTIPGFATGSSTISNLTAGTYTVTITDVNGCSTVSNPLSIIEPPQLTISSAITHLLCYNQGTGSVDITIGGGTVPYTYNWSNGNTNEDLSGANGGVYSVTVTDASGCTIAIGATINEPSQLVVTSTPGYQICQGEDAFLSITATGGTAPYTYYWNGAVSSQTITVTPVMPTTYIASVTDANGCNSNIAQTTIGVSPPIQITLIKNTDSICPGDPIVLTTVITGGIGPPYLIHNLYGDVITPPFVINPDSSMYYQILVEDGCGSRDTGSTSIFVHPLPPISFFSDISSGCQPLLVNFNEINPNTGQTYLWDFGDNDNLSVGKNPTHLFSDAGVFDVTLIITSAEGCKDTLTMAQMIHVYPTPQAGFTWTPQFATIIKPIIEFNNQSVGGSDFIWTFGDGDTSSLMNPVHSFPDAGLYPIQLVAISSQGCVDTVWADVQILDDWTFYAPDGFSPDNNSVNDMFVVRGHGILADGFQLIVYDRWGEVIFETDEYDPVSGTSKPWDGTAKDHKIVPVGTYTWIVKFYDFTHKLQEETGKVTVIR